MPLKATVAKLIFFIGNTQSIVLQGLQDEITGSFLNAATLVATLYDDQNNPVVGCINVSLPYVAASSGNYLGIFGDNTFLPDPGTGYTLIVTGSQAGVFIRMEIEVEVKPRQN